jgi:hypothetical protein
MWAHDRSEIMFLIRIKYIYIFSFRLGRLLYKLLEISKTIKLWNCCCSEVQYKAMKRSSSVIGSNTWMRHDTERERERWNFSFQGTCIKVCVTKFPLFFSFPWRNIFVCLLHISISISEWKMLTWNEWMCVCVCPPSRHSFGCRHLFCTSYNMQFWFWETVCWQLCCCCCCCFLSLLIS